MQCSGVVKEPNGCPFELTGVDRVNWATTPFVTPTLQISIMGVARY